MENPVLVIYDKKFSDRSMEVKIIAYLGLQGLTEGFNQICLAPQVIFFYWDGRNFLRVLCAENVINPGNLGR